MVSKAATALVHSGVPGACVHGNDPRSCPQCTSSPDPRRRTRVQPTLLLTPEWRQRWWYLDAANLCAVDLKRPISVPFTLHAPDDVGITISDSSCRKLVADPRPTLHRMLWTEEVGGVECERIRSVWVTSVSGCAMVGSATDHKISTLRPFWDTWGGYKGQFQFFAVPLEWCVRDKDWGSNARRKKVDSLLENTSQQVA